VVQPCEVTLFRPLKAAIHRRWLAWLLEHEDEALGLSQFEWRAQIVRVVAAAMGDVTAGQRRRGFFLAGIANAVDGSEDGFVRVVLRDGTVVDRRAARVEQQEREAAEAAERLSRRQAEAAARAAADARERAEQEASRAGQLPRLRPRRAALVPRRW